MKHIEMGKNTIVKGRCIMEKTEMISERSGFGKMLPPKLPLDKIKLQIPKKWTLIKETIFLGIGFLWGNTTVFQILNPMGIAYISAFLMQGKRFYRVVAAVSAGLLFSNFDEKQKYILCILFCLAFHWGASNKIKYPSTLLKASFGGGATMLGGVLFTTIRGGSYFYSGIAAIEAVAVFLLTYVVEKGVFLLQRGLKRHIMTSEEIMSIALLLGGAVAGSADMTIPICNIPIMAILSSSMILIGAYRGGAGIGTAAGVLFGFLLIVCGKIEMEVFCALSLGGLLCGAMKELGKIASVISFFIAVVVVLFYCNQTLLDIPFLEGLLIGSIIFLFVPKRAFAFINTYGVHEKEFQEDTYFLKMKELTEERLSQFATAFRSLGKTFLPELDKKTIGKNDVSLLIDNIADKACRNCGLAIYCWDTELYSTYQATFSALSVCEKKGRVELEQLSEAFRKNCVKSDVFVEVVNRCYEIFETQSIWRNKLAECRELVSQQLFAVGSIIENLSGQLDVRGIFLESIEKELKIKLDKTGISVEDISVMEDRVQHGTEVIITMKSCNGNNMCKEKIIPVISKALHKPMKKAGGKYACYAGTGGRCVLRLIEENKYRLTVATAACPKQEGGISGDSASFLETASGISVIALSDGMGSGITAREESKSAIELLEQFIEAGFEKELAINMINSVLLLRSAEEKFATLDICTVNLYTAKAEFMKMGAAAAYILRDGKIIAIRSETLPVGILQHVSMEKNDIILKHNDIVILMTDGIMEAVGEEQEDVAWLSSLFETFYSSNPQDVADYILQQAQKKAEQGRKDDMTVIAGRFWEI